MNGIIAGDYTQTMTHPVSLGLAEYQRISDEALREDANHKAGEQIPKFTDLDDLLDWITIDDRGHRPVMRDVDGKEVVWDTEHQELRLNETQKPYVSDFPPLTRMETMVRG